VIEIMEHIEAASGIQLCTDGRRLTIYDLGILNENDPLYLGMVYKTHLDDRQDIGTEPKLYPLPPEENAELAASDAPNPATSIPTNPTNPTKTAHCMTCGEKFRQPVTSPHASCRPCRTGKRRAEKIATEEKQTGELPQGWKKCVACHTPFEPKRQSATYCKAIGCQRVRQVKNQKRSRGKVNSVDVIAKTVFAPLSASTYRPTDKQVRG
jgi:hypothetical protein